MLTSHTNLWHFSEYLRTFNPSDSQGHLEILCEALESPHKYQAEIRDAEAWVIAGCPEEWPHVWAEAPSEAYMREIARWTLADERIKDAKENA